MNETDREILLRDVAATGLAVRKRRSRKLRALAMGGCGAIACLSLVMRIHSPEAKPAASHDMTQAHDASPPPNQRQQVAPPKVQTEREKDEALLNSLSQAGPVIITMADGSRQLYLTRP